MNILSVPSFWINLLVFSKYSIITHVPWKPFEEFSSIKIDKRAKIKRDHLQQSPNFHLLVKLIKPHYDETAKNPTATTPASAPSATHAYVPSPYVQYGILSLQTISSALLLGVVRASTNENVIVLYDAAVALFPPAYLALTAATFSPSPRLEVRSRGVAIKGDAETSVVSRYIRVKRPSSI